MGDPWHVPQMYASDPGKLIGRMIEVEGYGGMIGRVSNFGSGGFFSGAKHTIMFDRPKAKKRGGGRRGSGGGVGDGGSVTLPDGSRFDGGTVELALDTGADNRHWTSNPVRFRLVDQHETAMKSVRPPKAKGRVDRDRERGREAGSDAMADMLDARRRKAMEKQHAREARNRQTTELAAQAKRDKEALRQRRHDTGAAA